jgi:hypothetical protein
MSNPSELMMVVVVVVVVAKKMTKRAVIDAVFLR